MKTKKLILLLWVVFAVFFASSCEKKRLDRSGDEDLVHYLDYVFDEVVVPEAIRIRSNTNTSLNTSRTILFLSIEGKSYRAHRDDKVVPKPVSDFCERIGDIPRPKQYRRVSPIGGRALNRGITAIAIESEQDYNANHPAGTNLAPIVEVNYVSLDVDFKNLLSNGGSTDGIGIGYTRLLSEGIVECQIPSLRDIRLVFTEAPSQPKVKLRFVVTFDDGTSLERTEELEIHEAKS